MSMFEFWRRWNYKRHEHKAGTSDDFADFEKWTSGPWTPDIAAKMPWDKLIQGPQLGGIDPETRRVIDLEIEKRYRSRQPIVANFISLAALIVAVLALYRTW